MTSAENIPLTDFFNLYLESPRVLLIKNISDNTPRDTLENYLAAILNANVTAVHYPADVNGCCIAVFHRPIKGIWKFGKALDENPLDENVLDLCSLGRCDGLLIRNAPTELSSATVEGFLKSVEFTGTTEDCLKSIQYVNSDTGRFMLVQVPDNAVVSRILNRPEQPRCQNHDLDIDPYFPNLHDLIEEHNDNWRIPCKQTEVYEADETVAISYETCQERDETTDLYQGDDSIENDSGFPSNILTGSNETKRTSPFQINIYPDIRSFTESGESAFHTDSGYVPEEKEFNETDKDISSVSNSVCGLSIQTDEETVNPNALYPSLESISKHRSEDNLNLQETKEPGPSPVLLINSGAVNTKNIDSKPSLHSTDGSESSALKDIVEPKVTRRKRFHRKANELQYGLSEEEALKHAMEQSLSEHNIPTEDTSTSVRSGSNEGAEIPTSDIVQRLLTANQPECGTESTMLKTSEYYPGDPHMSQIDSAFTEAPHKSLVRSSSQEFFGSYSTRSDVATPSSDWSGQGAIPKSTGRPSRKGQKFNQSKVQEFQHGKSDDLALDEAIAMSLAEQEEKKILHNKNRPGRDQYRRQRSHSLDGKDKGRQDHRKPTSSGEQEYLPDSKQGPRKWQKGLQAAKYVPDTGAAFAGFIPDSKQGSATWQKRLQAAEYIPNSGAAISDVRPSKKETQRKAPKSHSQNEVAELSKGQVVYQQPLDKKGDISDGARTKIRDILKKHHVRCKDIAASKKYMLEGEEESVKKAYTEILETLLTDITENEKEAIKSRRAKRKEIRSKPEKVIEYMALKDDDAVPDYWKNFKPGSPIMSALQSFKNFVLAKDYYRVVLDSGDPVFKAIEKMTQSTWDERKVGHGKDAKGLDQLGYRRVIITKIQRIENLKLYERYSAHRKRMFIKTHQKGKKYCNAVENLPGSTGPVMTQGLTECPVLQHELFPQVNEHFFFHGTSKDVIDVICNGGLDFRVGSLNAMYGAGIYGAESSTKADQYVDPQDQRAKHDRKMFLVRIVLGESYLCPTQNPHKYRRPPCANMKHLRDDCKDISHGSFDSLIGQSRIFREFVVYDKDQCYPEYLITYNRV